MFGSWMRRFGQGFKSKNEIKGKYIIGIYIYIYIYYFLSSNVLWEFFFFFGLVLPKKPPTSNVINAKKI